MWTYYVIALIPCLLGLVFKQFNSKISWGEWTIGSIVAFIIAGILHICTVSGMTKDIETWSGQIINATYNPEWIEEYQEAIYRTESHIGMDIDGNLTHYTDSHFSHYETRHRTHPVSCQVISSYGTEFNTYPISLNTFEDIAKKFGERLTNRVAKTGFDGGDPNVYLSRNQTKYVLPTVTTRSFENKIKASPSTFSYSRVPDNILVFPYPNNNNIWQSNRLLGDVKGKISILEFDKMNARLGPIKKVNVIIVGFNSADAKLGHYQEQKWIGGKKNDIVICYGIGPLEDNVIQMVWARCFGWCENDQLKRNLEKIIMDNPINDNILPLIENEIRKNYVKKDWSKFDYIRIKPTKGWYWVIISSMTVVQLGLYILFHFNDIDEE